MVWLNTHRQSSVISNAHAVNANGSILISKSCSVELAAVHILSKRMCSSNNFFSFLFFSPLYFEHIHYCCLGIQADPAAACVALAQNLGGVRSFS